MVTQIEISQYSSVRLRSIEIDNSIDAKNSDKYTYLGYDFHVFNHILVSLSLLRQSSEIDIVLTIFR